MGRVKRKLELTENKFKRRITFKKGRINLLKKAMELKTITGCSIFMQVFSKDDGSLIEYVSTNASLKTGDDKDVKELIPDNLMHKLKLMSSPAGPISNIKYSSHVNVGKWVFEILQEAQLTSKTKKMPPKPRTRRKTQRK